VGGLNRVASIIVYVVALSTITCSDTGHNQTPTVLNKSEMMFRHTIIAAQDNLMLPHTKTVGDINGDHLVDVIVGYVPDNLIDGGGNINRAAGSASLEWYEYPKWLKHTIGLGRFSTDMQVGDIDGDGDLDVIVPHFPEEIRWYLNPLPAGNPGENQWKFFVIGSGVAHDVEVGDMNGDGKLDVVVRGQVPEPTRLFLQNTPTSWTKVVINTRSGEGTALADIDGDGDLDVVQDGYWLEAPEDKVNAPWTAHTFGQDWPARVGVFVADMNADGRPDILIAPSESEGGRLSWYEAPVDPKNDGWIEHVIEKNADFRHTFKVADIDNDGDPDVVTAEMHQSTDPDEVAVYRNTGHALSWSKEVLARTGSHNLRVADIGNDGDMDIIGANWGGAYHPIEMWESLPKVSGKEHLSLDQWERHVIDSSKPWRSLFVSTADLDGDGRKDVITGGWWYKNPGALGQQWARQVIGAPLNNMAVVYDFDRDGDMDVLGTQGQGSDANDSFVWARNDGSGSFTVLSNIAKGMGDFLQGVAVAEYQGQLQIALSWHNPGNGIQALTVPPQPSETGWSWQKLSETSQDEALTAGDIDGDGDMDLLLGTKWLRNEGAFWRVQTLNESREAPDRNRLGDINADGLLDAIVGFEAVSIPGPLVWYEQGSSSTAPWTEHVIDTVIGPMSLDVADMDGDGDFDVVIGEHNLAEPSKASLYIYENTDGLGHHWSRHVVYTGDEHHDGAQLVDIDGDGDLDILSIGWSHNQVLLYENKSL
jgi:hypothetical protein